MGCENICCGDTKNLRIELGCGFQPKEGFIGIDKYDFGQKIIRDIERGLPFCDSCVDEIYTSHCLEHLHDWLFIFNEMWRVCKNGAKITIGYPRLATLGELFFSPDHKIFYCDDFFRIITFPETDVGLRTTRVWGLKAKYKLISINHDEVNNGIVELEVVK
jgi:predicted SAM-dependent methyltransferase